MKGTQDQEQGGLGTGASHAFLGYSNGLVPVRGSSFCSLFSAGESANTPDRPS